MDAVIRTCSDRAVQMCLGGEPLSCSNCFHAGMLACLLLRALSRSIEWMMKSCCGHRQPAITCSQSGDSVAKPTRSFPSVEGFWPQPLGQGLFSLEVSSRYRNSKANRRGHGAPRDAFSSCGRQRGQLASGKTTRADLLLGRTSSKVVHDAE